jgi:PadR family transcriptional regulator PadR
MDRQRKAEIRQGTLALMILKTLESMGALHGYGIARRIEQISGDEIEVRYGTIYPSLIKLEQEGFVSSRWDTSANSRRAKYYELTCAGRKRIRDEARLWGETVSRMARFLRAEKEPG